MSRPTYAAGKNIAMKVPPHEYEATVRFYRDVIGLAPLPAQPPEVGFEFGGKHLWIDRVESLSRSEVWLEIVTDDLAAAEAHLASEGVVRCDKIEPLPEGFKAFWVMNPASVVHLVCKE